MVVWFFWQHLIISVITFGSVLWCIHLHSTQTGKTFINIKMKDFLSRHRYTPLAAYSIAREIHPPGFFLPLRFTWKDET